MPVCPNVESEPSEAREKTPVAIVVLVRRRCESTMRRVPVAIWTCASPEGQCRVSNSQGKPSSERTLRMSRREVPPFDPLRERRRAR